MAFVRLLSLQEAVALLFPLQHQLERAHEGLEVSGGIVLSLLRLLKDLMACFRSNVAVKRCTCPARSH